MRIVGIEPKPPGIHVYTRLNLPRLGLPLLGALLKNRGHKVDLFVEDIHPINYALVAAADWVLISTTTSTTPAGYKIADEIRDNYGRSKKIVMGGSHVTFMPEEALAHCDYVVRGEGHDTILELVEAKGNFGKLKKIEGISFNSPDGIIHNPDRKKTEDLDTLPFPNFSLIHGHEKMRITPIMTSWGCPFPCTFCSVTRMFGRKYRFRSTENVIREIKANRPKQIFFYDDNFTANPKRTKELLRRMIEEDLIIPWSAQVRVDVVRDLELLALMKKSGCFKVYLGLESVNPETLKEYDKKQTVEHIKEGLRLLRQYGITTHGMFVIGSDTDGSKAVKETVRFCKKNFMDTIQLGILTPLPGTPLFDQLIEEKRLFCTDWSLQDAHHVVFVPKHMSPAKLQRKVNLGLLSFYSPLRILNLFLRGENQTAFFNIYGSYLVLKLFLQQRGFRRNLKKIPWKRP